MSTSSRRHRTAPVNGRVLDDLVDVLVCGGGMAGLCAAASAVEAGAHPLVIEKGANPGGSMLMSGGTIWTAPTMEIMEAWVPGGDRTRQRRLVEGLAPGLEWLDSLGLSRTSPISNDRQTGAEVDTGQLTAGLIAAIQSGGGTVLTELALESIAVDRDGIVSAAVVDADGRRTTIRARSLILATGGFGGSPELLARHVGPYAHSMLLRANPRSVGDGLGAAITAGGRSTTSMSTFYGHTMPGLPASVPAAEWVSVTQYYTQDAILVNALGERFFDESRSMADETAAFEIVRQPEGRAWLVMDRRIHDDVSLPGRSPSRVGPAFANAVAAGAPNVTVDSISGLADGLAALGVDRPGFLATIEAFDRAMAAGNGGKLRVPRERSPFGLVEPPFRALAVRPGITFTLGGIDVDADLRVLDREGRPIPSLFAAGADAGGTYDGGYMGGLVMGLVQGRAAGHSAARSAAASRFPLR
jgi:succinate dehydrogenase/fumarate reductase flavoprotein subunit